MDRRIIDKNILTKNIQLHPESQGVNVINNLFNTTYNDLNIIDENIINISNDLNILLDNTMMKIEELNDKITLQKEYLQDMNMLCGGKLGFDNVIRLTDKDFKGEFSYINKTFTAKVQKQIKTKYKINDVLGNGYQGNEYILDEDQFVKETFDSSNLDYLKDNKLSNYWEYSRLIANNNETYVIPEINFDIEYAKCTLFIELESLSEQIILNTKYKDIIVTNVSVSVDGNEYTNLSISDLKIDDIEESYNKADYIYGSGIIHIPSSRFIQITLQSTSYLEETIGFNKKDILPTGDFEDEYLYIIPTAKRSVIAINELIVNNVYYDNDSIMTTDELLKDKSVDSIALYCNYYIPENLKRESITFYAIVNGVQYEIAPINSHYNKKKIIRYSTSRFKAEHAIYIDETIKSFKLKIIMHGKNNVTPYLKNIKLLLGGDAL